MDLPMNVAYETVRRFRKRRTAVRAAIEASSSERSC